MNLVRAIDVNGDWTFGFGKNNYLTGNPAIGQQIRCRLLQFLGECFFDLSAGIDWFNLLGGKDLERLKLAISSVILNTQGVTGFVQLFADLNERTRELTIEYSVTTVYSVLTNKLQFTVGQ